MSDTATSGSARGGLILDVTMRFVTGGHCCNDNAIGSMELRSLDGGGGRYFVLNADEFAVDYIEELIDILAACRDRIEPPFPGEYTP